METVDYFAQLKSQLTVFAFLNGDGLTVSRLGISITLFFKRGTPRRKNSAFWPVTGAFGRSSALTCVFTIMNLKG